MNSHAPEAHILFACVLKLRLGGELMIHPIFKVDDYLLGHFGTSLNT